MVVPLVLSAHLPLIDSLDSVNFLYLTDSLQEDVSTCLHNMPRVTERQTTNLKTKALQR
jgi:hypothetical protein